MKMIYSLLISSLVFLSSCATSYQKSGFSGGYKDEVVQDNVFRVKFSGNGYATRETAQTYWLYRCAELTLEKGYTAFEVISPLQLGLQFWEFDPDVQMVATFIYIPMYTSIHKPEIEGDIRLLKEDQHRPPKIFNAKKLKDSLTQYVLGQKCDSGNVCPHVKTYLSVESTQKPVKN